MRNLIIGVAAAVMAMAAPGLASADVRATVGAQYAHQDFGHGDNADVVGLNGAFNDDFGNGWTLQGDGVSNRVDFGSGPAEGFGYGAVSAGVRNDQWAAYGYVGLADGSFIPSTSEIGIGGQLYFNNITLDGSFSYADIDGAHSNPTDISVDGSYFFNDNFDVTARYSHIDTDGFTGDDNFNVYGVAAEYRFANSPVSVNLCYSHADTNPDSSNTWTVGVKMDLGSDSLRDRSTHGPSWNGAGSFFTDLLGTL